MQGLEFLARTAIQLHSQVVMDNPEDVRLHRRSMEVLTGMAEALGLELDGAKFITGGQSGSATHAERPGWTRPLPGTQPSTSSPESPGPDPQDESP